MLWKVSVTRTSTATRDIIVEADTKEEADSKAEEQACNEDYEGCVVDYEYGVDGATPINEDDIYTDNPVEEEPDLSSEEKRCPDLGYGVCSICCKTSFPGVSDETIDAGWFPSYFEGEDECEGPVCPTCVEQFLVCDAGGEATLRVDGEYVSVWDGGVEIRAKCVCDPRTRKVVIDRSQNANVDVLDREYVHLNGKEYTAAHEDYRYEYTPEEQSRMFFWE